MICDWEPNLPEFLPNDPTPEQISACCKLIQSGWSHDEMVSRYNGQMPGSNRRRISVSHIPRIR